MTEQELKRGISERRLAMLELGVMVLKDEVLAHGHSPQADREIARGSLRTIHEQCLLIACDLGIDNVFPPNAVVVRA